MSDDEDTDTRDDIVTGTASPAKGSGFFAVDRKQWPRVCGLGMNAAVAYLVLARGSDRSNRRTTWSANAIADRTSVSRRRAHAAIDALAAAGIVRQSKGGARPAYELPSVLGVMPKRKGKTAAADTDEPAAWVWLPNTLVDGLPEAPGASPLERVRQTGDVMILRLLVDLYGAHELRDDGGIDRRIAWHPHESQVLGEYAQYRLIAFTPDKYRHCGAGKHPVVDTHKVVPGTKGGAADSWGPFWERWNVLEQLGLVQWSTVLWEAAAPDAEPIHPLNGPEPDEHRIGIAAHNAALGMLETIGVLEVPPRAWLVPVLKHFTKAAAIGIARLRYRPHTTATAAWFSDLKERAVEHEARYLELTNQLSAVGYGR